MKLYTFQQLVEAPDVRVEWLLPGLLPASGWTLLVGMEKAGKTTLALQLADALATGGLFLGLTPTRACRVLLVETDSPLPELKEQLSTIAPASPAQVIDPPQGFLFSTERAFREVVQSLRPEFVVWDALESLGDPRVVDLNTVQGAARLLGRLKEFCPTFLVIHHERKSDPGQGPEDPRRASSASHRITADASSIWGLRAALSRPTGELHLRGRLYRPNQRLIPLTRLASGRWSLG